MTTIGKKQLIPTHDCPYECGAHIYAASGFDESAMATPSEGDATICGRCGGPLIYNADQTTRKPTDAELQEMQDIPAFRKLYELRHLGKT